MDNFNEIKNRIEYAQFNLTDDDLFKECVSQTMQDLNLEDIVFANSLAVSRSTVNRWKNGKAIPHPLMRKPVYESLKRFAYDKFYDENF